ncbi:MAG: hypothetical protein IJW54_07015 [Clostridia bacterium]|nr:hypothetical protein [Clostridia bacterium]
MINGYERRIMQLRNIKSPYFDEAYFVMKDNCEHFIESEVLCEAERILGTTKISKRKKGVFGRLIYTFSCGLLLGAIIAFVITLFI